MIQIIVGGVYGAMLYKVISDKMGWNRPSPLPSVSVPSASGDPSSSETVIPANANLTDALRKASLKGPSDDVIDAE